MDPILRFLRRLSEGDKVSTRSVAKAVEATANKMSERQIIAKRIPPGSRTLKWCVINEAALDSYCRNQYPLGLFAEELELDTRESAAKSRRGSKRTGARVEEVILCKVFCESAVVGEVSSLLVQSTSTFGVAVFTHPPSNITASGLWVSIENHESFHVVNKANSPSFDGAFLLSGQPSAKQINWMGQSTESGCSFVHFGDLDFAGLTHYIQLRNRLGDAITFWSPQDIGVDLFKHLGNRVLFKRQMSSAKYNIENLRGGLRGDEDALHILRLIVETGCVIEQEALHNEFLRSRD